MKYLITLILLIITSTAFPGPPFNTDDPEPVPYRHWEFYLSSINSFQHNLATGTLPHFELNYGLVPNLQFHAQIPMNYTLINGKDFDYGTINTELGFKYRFYNNEESNLQIATYPMIEIPTFKNENLGSSQVQLLLPIWIQKSWNKFTSYAGSGYNFNPGPGNKNWIFAGWQVQYECSKTCTIGTELIYKSPAIINSNAFYGLNFGGFVNLNENIHLLYSLGHSLANENITIAYLGCQITI